MPQSIQITETSPLLHDANCVYCHVDLDLGDHAVVCDSCRSPHHADCWQANRSKCATFGCNAADTDIVVSHEDIVVEQDRSTSRHAMQDTVVGFAYIIAAVFCFTFFYSAFNDLFRGSEGSAFIFSLLLGLAVPFLGMTVAVPYFNRLETWIRSLFVQ